MIISHLTSKIAKAFIILLSLIAFTSCLKDDAATIRLSSGLNDAGIPGDYMATENPYIGTSTTVIPNVNYTMETVGNDVVIRVDMTGVYSRDIDEWIRLIGTGEEGQNIWLSIDGQPKGILVYNTIDDIGENVVVKNDIVFLVDNSGSMDQEADAIARDIISWAQTLKTKSDVQFGCVGYDGRITGAMNITSYENINTYLQTGKGTSRTMGFSGPDASSLKSKSTNYNISESQVECCMAALRYADACFNFRQGANRIYVNFTDEPNQPSGKSNFSVNFLAEQSNWSTTQGTIHTVFSEVANITERTNYTEKPWRMSEYTGGTILYCNSSFTGVSLSSLPVTSAIQNSYIIRFTDIEAYMDGKPHEVKITIYSEDGSVRAERIFYMIFKSK